MAMERRKNPKRRKRVSGEGNPIEGVEQGCRRIVAEEQEQGCRACEKAGRDPGGFEYQRLALHGVAFARLAILAFIRDVVDHTDVGGERDYRQQTRNESRPTA